jgi:hypothetical protein
MSKMHTKVNCLSSSNICHVQRLKKTSKMIQFNAWAFEGVGKEMPISRIVIAVPNTTVVLLD